MDYGKLMREAQKMSKKLEKEQEELNKTEYTGNSSLVTVVLNGKMDVLSVKINCDDNLDKDDIELLEDSVMVAFNDALKKINTDKNDKFGKYGQGLSGLM